MSAHRAQCGDPICFRYIGFFAESVDPIKLETYTAGAAVRVEP